MLPFYVCAVTFRILNAVNPYVFSFPLYFKKTLVLDGLRSSGTWHEHMIEMIIDYH
jgi:hypothetical protein